MFHRSGFRRERSLHMVAPPLLLVLVLAVLTACGSDDAESAGESAVSLKSPTVTVDLYSGVQNPTFDLSPAAVLQLEEALADIGPGDFTEATLPEGSLGFRGFAVAATDDTGKEFEYQLLPEAVFCVKSQVASSATEGASDPYRVVWDEISGEFDQTLIQEVPPPKE